MTYERFIELICFYESQMKVCEEILNKAKKSDFGLTLESEKTEEWRKAKSLFQMYFDATRKLNKENKQHVKRAASERRQAREKQAN